MQELPLIVELQRFLYRTDGVDETAVAHTAVLCDDRARLCADEPLFFKTGYVLPHCIFAQPHRLADGAVARMTLIGHAILAAEKKIIDRDLVGAEAEAENLVGHKVVMLDRVAFRPALEHQASPPVCSSTP